MITGDDDGGDDDGGDDDGGDDDGDDDGAADEERERVCRMKCSQKWHFVLFWFHILHRQQ